MKHIKRLSLLSSLLVFSILLCHNGCTPDNELILPDVSHIEPEVNWIATEKLISELDLEQLSTQYLTLSREHPEFFEIYNQNALPLTKSKDGSINYEELKTLFQDTFFVNLVEVVNERFDQEQLIEEYKSACQYVLYHFPDIDTPDLYSFISLYNYQLFLFGENENRVGVGLDMFLNEDVPYKKLDPKNPNFSEYLTRSYNGDHIIPKVITSLLEEELRIVQGTSFLDQIIASGKLHYIKKQILPTHHDTLIHEHSFDQWRWLQNNEKEIFSFFKEKEMFYETNQNVYIRYVTPGPNSPGMPSSAPARTGNFIGFKIVQAYIAKNKELSLKDLINISANDIFQKSRYKPPR